MVKMSLAANTCCKTNNNLESMAQKVRKFIGQVK